MNLRAQIKYWLALNQMTYENLAQKLSEITGKKYTSGGIHAKLNRGTLTFKEFEVIAGIFRYTIKLEENK